MVPKDREEPDAQAIVRRALALVERWLVLFEEALERAEGARRTGAEAPPPKPLEPGSLREVANALTICTRAEALRRTLSERSREGAHGELAAADLEALERALSEPLE